MSYKLETLLLWVLMLLALVAIYVNVHGLAEVLSS
jgi:hypothetical protein